MIFKCLTFIDAIIAGLRTFLWFSGCSRRPWWVWRIDRWESPATHPFAPYHIQVWKKLVCIRLGLIWMNMFHAPDIRPSLNRRGTQNTCDLWSDSCIAKLYIIYIYIQFYSYIYIALPPERSLRIAFSAHLYSRSSSRFCQIRVSVYNAIWCNMNV